MIFLLALLLGVVAGLRAMMPPAALAWFVHLGWLSVAGTWFEFLGSAWARGAFTLLALVELVIDQLPTTPSRTTPMPFAARLISGAFGGGAIGAADDTALGGALAGMVGAAIGALGGRRLRGQLAAALGNDHPAAFLEDALAIAGAALIGVALR